MPSWDRQGAVGRTKPRRCIADEVLDTGYFSCPLVGAVFNETCYILGGGRMELEEAGVSAESGSWLAGTWKSLPLTYELQHLLFGIMA